MRAADAGGVLPAGGGDEMNKTNQPVDKRIYICHVCGKAIQGPHEIVRRGRYGTLHIHYGCAPGRRAYAEKQ